MPAAIPVVQPPTPAATPGPTADGDASSPLAVYAAQCESLGCRKNSLLLRTLPAAPVWESITELDLSRNVVGRIGVLPVLAVARLASNLTALSLAANSLDNASVQAVVAALVSHAALQSLDLSRNPITHAGGKLLARFAVASPAVHTIALGGTLISPALIRIIQLNASAKTGAHGPSGASTAPSAEGARSAPTAAASGRSDGSAQSKSPTAAGHQEAGSKPLLLSVESAAPPGIEIRVTGAPRSGKPTAGVDSDDDAYSTDTDLTDDTSSDTGSEAPPVRPLATPRPPVAPDPLEPLRPGFAWRSFMTHAAALAEMWSEYGLIPLDEVAWLPNGFAGPAPIPADHPAMVPDAVSFAVVVTPAATEAPAAAAVSGSAPTAIPSMLLPALPSLSLAGLLVKSPRPSIPTLRGRLFKETEYAVGEEWAGYFLSGIHIAMMATQRGQFESEHPLVALRLFTDHVETMRMGTIWRSREYSSPEPGGSESKPLSSKRTTAPAFSIKTSEVAGLLPPGAAGSGKSPRPVVPLLTGRLFAKEQDCGLGEEWAGYFMSGIHQAILAIEKMETEMHHEVFALRLFVDITESMRMGTILRSRQYTAAPSSKPSGGPLAADAPTAGIDVVPPPHESRSPPLVLDTLDLLQAVSDGASNTTDLSALRLVTDERSAGPAEWTPLQAVWEIAEGAGQPPDVFGALRCVVHLIPSRSSSPPGIPATALAVGPPRLPPPPTPLFSVF